MILAACLPVMTLGSSVCGNGFSQQTEEGELGRTLREFWRIEVEREIPRTLPVALNRYLHARQFSMQYFELQGGTDETPVEAAMSLGSTEEMRAMSVIVMMAPYPILCSLSQSVKIR